MLPGLEVERAQGVVELDPAAGDEAGAADDPQVGLGVDQLARPQGDRAVLALGAVLPPSDGRDVQAIIQDVPAKRWAAIEEVGEAVRFLLEGPSYITGEVLTLDGGRHLL